MMAQSQEEKIAEFKKKIESELEAEGRLNTPVMSDKFAWQGPDEIVVSEPKTNSGQTTDKKPMK